jgi:hypothetical protein
MFDPLEDAIDRTDDLEWANHPDTIREHYDALLRVIEQAYSEPYIGHDSDFGVLYVGGGRYWPGVVVGVRLLRHVGYKGPIEIWHGHYSDSEPIEESDVASYDVRITNALEVAKTTRPRILRGWEAKLHAIRHTRFRRILFLDADAYCVHDPTPYFDRFHDFAFWGEDNRDHIRWPNVVLSERKRNVVGVQGGQLFIDREKAWPLVIASDWICQHSDFYFQHIFGDQDAWRLVLSLTDLPYTVIGSAIWNKPALVCSIDKRKFIVHRVYSKLFRACDWSTRSYAVDFAPHLPLEGFVWKEFAKLAEHKIEDCEIAFKNLYYRGAKHVFDLPSNVDHAYIKYITTLVASYNLKKIVDLGCGNGRITKEIARRTGIEVVGVDCVREILPESDLPNLSFAYANALEVDSLPEGDILLMKDVLSYWPFMHINTWIRKILEKPRWRFIVITNDTTQFPAEMPWGRHHGVNPELYKSLCKLDYKQIRLGNKLALLLKTGV